MTAFQELSFFVYNHIKSLVFYINIHYHKHNYISDHNSDIDLYIFVYNYTESWYILQ